MQTYHNIQNSLTTSYTVERMLSTVRQAVIESNSPEVTWEAFTVKVDKQLQDVCEEIKVAFSDSNTRICIVHVGENSRCLYSMDIPHPSRFVEGLREAQRLESEGCAAAMKDAELTLKQDWLLEWGNARQREIAGEFAVEWTRASESYWYVAHTSLWEVFNLNAFVDTDGALKPDAPYDQLSVTYSASKYLKSVMRGLTKQQRAKHPCMATPVVSNLLARIAEVEEAVLLHRDSLLALHRRMQHSLKAQLETVDAALETLRHAIRPLMEADDWTVPSPDLYGDSMRAAWHGGEHDLRDIESIVEARYNDCRWERAVMYNAAKSIYFQ